MNILLILFIIILLVVVVAVGSKIINKEGINGPGYYLLSWTLPSDGGDPNITYDLTISGGNEGPLTVTDLTDTSYQFKTSAMGTTYIASVTAKNSGGVSDAGKLTFSTFGDPTPTILLLANTTGSQLKSGDPIGDIRVIFSLNSSLGVVVSESSTLLITGGGVCIYKFSAAGDISQIAGSSNPKKYRTTFSLDSGTTCTTFKSGARIQVQLIVSNPAAQITTSYTVTL